MPLAFFISAAKIFVAICTSYALRKDDYVF